MSNFPVIYWTESLDVLAPRCRHGLATRSCLSIECIRPSVPIKGEASWDSKLQQPNDTISLNPYLTSFPFPSLNFSLYGLTNRTSSPSVDLPVERREMPVIGYRAWYMSKSKGKIRLRGLNNNAWEAEGVTEARCTIANPYLELSGTQPPHVSPDQNCECGLYVLSNLKDAPHWLGRSDWSVDVAIGAVLGWGQVIQHGVEGWRAQYARPLAFLNTATFGPQPKLDKLADQIGVPILPREGLEIYVKEFGEVA